MRSKLIPVIWILLALGMIACAAEKQPEIAKLLPAKGDVKGWSPMESSLLYGAGYGLTVIYDGAYPEYQKQGVEEAAQQLYQSADKKRLMEIIVNRIKTEKQARTFFENQRKKLGGDKPVGLGKGEMFVVSSKPVQGYVRVRNHVASAVPAYEGKTALADTKAFLKAVGKKLERAKPKSGR